MDKETYNQDFIHWDRVDKDALCDAMYNILGEAARKGIHFNILTKSLNPYMRRIQGLKNIKLNDSNKRAQVVKYLDLTCRSLKLNVCRTHIQPSRKR